MAKVVIHDGLINLPPDSPLECLDVTRTVQDAKDECDINLIMARYQRTGLMPEGIGTGTYGDFSQALEFQDAQNLLIRAREQFEALPSKIRDRFHNNPVELLDFVHNVDNKKEAQELGLLNKEPPVVDPAAAAAGTVAPPGGAVGGGK